MRFLLLVLLLIGFSSTIRWISLSLSTCVSPSAPSAVSHTVSSTAPPLDTDSPLRQFARATLEQDLPPVAFRDFALRLRFLRDSNATYQNGLLPWLPPTFVPKWQHQKGIVIPVSNAHMAYAVHLVRTLQFLQCTLPIWIAFDGDLDLGPAEQVFLQQLDQNVNLLDLSKIFNTSHLSLRGWQLKPFAMLFCPVEEVLVMDADIVWLQNPAFLFDEKVYQQDHVLLFRDRTISCHIYLDPRACLSRKDWIQQQVPRPWSTRFQQSRMFQGTSGHEQESGVMLWNKRHRLFSLLMACKFNLPQERDQFFLHFHGDKEAYWLSLEMLQEGYATLWPLPGSIGKPGINSAGQLLACGRILQFDRNGQPLFFNGGVVYDKRNPVLRQHIYEFTYFGHQLEGNRSFLDLKTECLGGDTMILNPSLQKLIRDICTLFRLNPLVESLENQSAILSLPSKEAISNAGRI